MRATTKAVKKKAVKSLPRETSMSKSDKENSIDEMRQRRYRQRAYDCGYRDGGRWGSPLAISLQAQRKKTRELKREVTRLTAIVVSQAEKLI